MKKFAIVTIFAFLTAVGMPMAAFGGDSNGSRSVTLYNGGGKNYKKSKRVKRKPSKRCAPRRSSRVSQRNNRSQSNYRVAGQSYQRQQPRRSVFNRHRNVRNIAIGSGAGAIVGGIIGGKRGALIGAGVGAGAGAAYTYGINPKKKRGYRRNR